MFASGPSFSRRPGASRLAAPIHHQDGGQNRFGIPFGVGEFTTHSSFVLFFFFSKRNGAGEFTTHCTFSGWIGMFIGGTPTLPPVRALEVGRSVGAFLLVAGSEGQIFWLFRRAGVRKGHRSFWGIHHLETNLDFFKKPWEAEAQLIQKCLRSSMPFSFPQRRSNLCEADVAERVRAVETRADQLGVSQWPALCGQTIRKAVWSKLTCRARLFTPRFSQPM